MPSLHRTPRSPYWYAAIYLPNRRRAFRSTGTTDKRKAMGIALEWDKAGRIGREGRLTEARARDTLDAIFRIANNEALPSASAREFMNAWLSKKEHELAAGSLPSYQKAVEHFTVSLGTKVDRSADGVTVADVLTFRGTLSQRVSGGSVNKYLLILRGAWTEGVKAGVVRENVFTKAGTVKADHSERRAFTLSELHRILDACSQEWRTMVLCGVYMGQRLGDIATLTWRQVDLARGEVTLTTGKTGRHMVIPLAAPLTRALTALPSADAPDAPVFPKAHATADINRGTLSRQFVEILANAGLVERQSHKTVKRGGRSNRRTVGGLSFHCLRHTATSLLKNAGVSDVVAREFIGHDSEAVSRVYTHIETNTLRRAVDLLPDVTAK